MSTAEVETTRRWPTRWQRRERLPAEIAAVGMRLAMAAAALPFSLNVHASPSEHATLRDGDVGAAADECGAAVGEIDEVVGEAVVVTTAGGGDGGG